MPYAVTDVSASGARTVELRDKSVALSHYAMMRADPHNSFVQLVEAGGVLRQFVRHMAGVSNLEIEA